MSMEGKEVMQWSSNGSRTTNSNNRKVATAALEECLNRETIEILWSACTQRRGKFLLTCEASSPLIGMSGLSDNKRDANGKCKHGDLCQTTCLDEMASPVLRSS
jgi:hypothetical protein